ncbi:MAG TPA: NUDIX domain-containing protein [Daejeonella sp.]|nr:NUDIX domain-containing protein [Daejeonella sp.]
MAKKSAGLLLYRFINSSTQVLLVHPGGPFWINKDLGAWSIPKGEFDHQEEPLTAAVREVKEELGLEVSGDFLELLPAKQKSGKIIYAWGVEHDFNPENIVSNTFELEWPPNSGKTIVVPEVDKASWFNIEDAKRKIIPAQAAIIDDLLQKIQ